MTDSSPIGTAVVQDAQGAARKNWLARHKILTGLGVVLILIVVAAIASGGGSKDQNGANVAAAVSGGATSIASSDVQPTVGSQRGSKPAEASGQPSHTSRSVAPTKPHEALPRIGDPVRDGKFEFIVKRMTCGKSRIGDDMLGTNAQGQFCLIDMTVKNIGNEAQTFFGSNQKVYDAKDREFDADDEASIYLPDSNALAEPVNPGNQVSGKVVFDVPKGVTPVLIELHDSAFSGGVKVSLK